ncbi:hypothetical protein GXM_01949 [Nostoc sphaeroides CCNUC1]|uniref:Uncharacterized protein n=1 Tax=Nostoc sphaeroides CCNUC1 TaxID=2653204 RepID=A0A5P8VVT6_9NOSO|nr:hypothetical protein GXM_01949 [Nostoc sphaeroides CCNUC1]
MQICLTTIPAPRLGRILEKLGLVSSSGKISTYQEVLIKKICLQFL